MATKYIRGANPIWWLPDLEGQPLNDEYYIFYLSNTFPYLPQLVYRDNQGLVPWSDPVQFLANGTLPDNIYFAEEGENIVYRLEVRHGNTQDDQLIYEVNDYLPGNGGDEGEEVGNQSNQISNPQFAFISFESPLSIAAAGTYQIAPGWQLVLSGSGTATITQLIFSGDQNLPDDPVPPYAMRFNLNGWTTATLQQRFNGVGAIWSNTFVSMSVLARSDDSVERDITLVYSPNSPGTPVTITTGTLSTSAYAYIQGIVALPTSTDTTDNDDAYVDMQVLLPASGIVDISNIQVMGQNAELPLDFTPEPDETLERQEDHLFHFYNPQLQYKPIKSYLVGWDFMLNPAQPRGTTVASQALGANTSYYAWDQTIIFQSVDNSISIAKGVSPSNPGELAITAAATTSFAVIQYLPQNIARLILNSPICTNIQVTTAEDMQCTVSLYYTKDVSLPAIGSNQSLVATLDADGKPATFHGTWFEVPREPDQRAQFTVPNIPTTDYPSNGFSGWDLAGDADANLATFFAIVVGFSALPITGLLGIKSVSLNAGTIPTIPAPQTQDEVLRECQFYYEKSYAPATVPGTATLVGMLSAPQTVFETGGDEKLAGKSFYLPYKQTKRTVPSLHLYSPATGAIDNISMGILSSGAFPAPTAGANPRDISSASWSGSASESVNGVDLIVQSTGAIFTVSPAVDGDEGIARFHYTADSRLGVN